MWFHIFAITIEILVGKKRTYTRLRQEYIMLAWLSFLAQIAYWMSSIFTTVADHGVRNLEIDTSVENITCSSFMKRSVLRGIFPKEELRCPLVLFMVFNYPSFWM